jgi:hypothetical protein
VLRFARGEQNFLALIDADEDLRRAVMANRTNIIYSKDDPRGEQARIKEIGEAEGREFGYGLHARYGSSNGEAADQLAQVMNFVNGRFVPGKEPFRGAILYKDEDGGYVSREWFSLNYTMERIKIALNILGKMLTIGGRSMRPEDRFTEAYRDHADSNEPVLNLEYGWRFSEHDSPIETEKNKLRETYGVGLFQRVNVSGSMMEDAHYVKVADAEKWM